MLISFSFDNIFIISISSMNLDYVLCILCAVLISFSFDNVFIIVISVTIFIYQHINDVCRDENIVS